MLLSHTEACARRQCSDSAGAPPSLRGGDSGDSARHPL